MARSNWKKHLSGIFLCSLCAGVGIALLMALGALIFWLCGVDMSSMNRITSAPFWSSFIGIPVFILFLPAIIIGVLAAPLALSYRIQFALDAVVISLFWGAALYWFVLMHISIKEIRRLKKAGLLPKRKLSGKEEYDRILAEAREQEKAQLAEKQS